MSDLSALAPPTGEYLGSAPAATLSLDTAPDTVPDTASRFAELVCADPELLRAEFEALIAANYPHRDGRRCGWPPPRKRPPRIDRARPAPRAISSSRPGFLLGPGGRKGRTGADRAPRERGPP